jgi:beta-lactamase regulating signal transducer with metallopeptidase domain
MIPAFLSPLVNHFWQSMIFAVVVGLLTLALRKSPARTRYWLWLGASVKFLIPFYLLVSIGSHIEWRTGRAMEPPEWPRAVERISQPLIAPPASPRSHPVGLPPAATPIPALLFLVWACGSVGVLFSCWLRWRRIRVAQRQAYPLDLPIHIKVMSSPALLEPAVFGILRPVCSYPKASQNV